MSAADVRGRLLWYELMTTDMKAAAKFYTAVIGWTTTPFDGAGIPYTMFNRAPDTPVGGVLNRPADVDAPPFWAMYVGVPALEDAVAHVTRLGGRSVSPVVEVPDIGRMQLVADPQGAVVYLYEPASADQPAEAAATIGDGSWHELMTTDAPAAMAFYGEVFGWKPTESMDMGEMGAYHMFGRHLGSLGGMMNKPPEMAAAPSAWAIYFHVPAINEAVARVTAAGGQILNGPMEVPGGDWVVNAVDPQGAAFSLHAKKP